MSHLRHPDTTLPSDDALEIVIEGREAQLRRLYPDEPGPMDGVAFTYRYEAAFDPIPPRRTPAPAAPQTPRVLTTTDLKALQEAATRRARKAAAQAKGFHHG